MKIDYTLQSDSDAGVTAVIGETTEYVLILRTHDDQQAMGLAVHLTSNGLNAHFDYQRGHRAENLYYSVSVPSPLADIAAIYRDTYLSAGGAHAQR